MNHESFRVQDEQDNKKGFSGIDYTLNCLKNIPNLIYYVHFSNRVTDRTFYAGVAVSTNKHNHL